jgi:hypothetical protein
MRAAIDIGKDTDIGAGRPPKALAAKRIALN